MGFRSPRPLSKELNLEIGAGEKRALVCATESQRHIISRLLSGLETPRAGAIRYNDIDVRNINPEEINSLRGLVFGRDLSLLRGTVAENITMGRAGIKSEDIVWGLQFVRLDKEIEHLPEGLNTLIQLGAKEFSPSQILRILLARAIVMRPKLLILDGALHEIPHPIRKTILAQLCSDQEPWTVVIVTTDSNIQTYVRNCETLV